MPIDPQFFQHLPPYVAALVESIGNSPKGALTCDGQSIALQCPNIGFLNEVRNFVDDLQVAAALVGYEFRLDYLNSGN